MKDVLLTKSIKENSAHLMELAQTNFLTGFELEFVLPANKETDYYNYRDLKGNSIFGQDGDFPHSPNPSKEFRTPVFLSKNLESVFRHIVKFTLDAVDYLSETWKANFSPEETIDIPAFTLPYKIDHSYYTKVPLGFHYSICNFGLFDKLLHDITERSKDVAINLDTLFDPLYKDLLNNRAANWEHSPKRGSNWIKPQSTRTEFRFFPSCDIRTIIPYLEYIYFGGDMPTNIITIKRNH